MEILLSSRTRTGTYTMLRINFEELGRELVFFSLQVHVFDVGVDLQVAKQQMNGPGERTRGGVIKDERCHDD